MPEHLRPKAVVLLLLVGNTLLAAQPGLEKDTNVRAHDQSSSSPPAPARNRSRPRRTPKFKRSMPCIRLRVWSRIADLANGAVLIMSAPLALRGGISSLAALRSVLLGGWLSSFGALLVIVESRVPIIHRWLRRNIRILTSNSGRLLLLLCASTMSLAIGPYGALVGLLTLANALFGYRVRLCSPRSQRPARPPAHGRIGGYGLPCPSASERMGGQEEKGGSLRSRADGSAETRKVRRNCGTTCGDFEE